MNANEMTLDQARDWLATDDGWMPTIVEPWGFPGWSRYEERTEHPYPPTLDGAASAMPDGWHWTREWQEEKWWSAFPDGWDGEPYPSVPDTGNPTHDLYRLAVACRMAMKGTP